MRSAISEFRGAQMIPALLNGKLSRDQENMEDILTSTVFGQLRYLPPEEGLAPFLDNIVHKGHSSFPALVFGPSTTVKYKFWPRLREEKFDEETETQCHLCEPDVLLRVRGPDDYRVNLLVEAKLWSGKSSGPSEDDSAPTDQLAREWDNLVCLSAEENAAPFLIYLTADFQYPEDKIQESQREFVKKRRGAPFCCGWLSWRHLERTFRESENPCLKDLAKLCRRLDLRFFDGIQALGSPPSLTWSFNRGDVEFPWLSQPPIALQWRFE